MTEETTDQKLARYEFVLDAYVRELTALREENARLKEGANALVTLQNIYRNSELPESIRTKAAQAAIQHEVPRLTPQPPAIDATCEVIEPLADVVRRQRARADRMLLEAREIRVLPSGQVIVLDEPNGNGGGEPTAS